MVYSFDTTSSSGMAAMYACLVGSQRRHARTAAKLEARRSAKKRSFIAIALLMLASAQAERAPPMPRRIIQRAENKWKGSTMFGYWNAGDDKTYIKNFRMSHQTMSAVTAHATRSGHFTSCVGSGGTQKACAARAIPISFKVAVCMYTFGQGTGFKAAADAASLGEATVRRWIQQFCRLSMKELRQLYMPPGPPSEEHLAAVKSQFASRRGVPDVALACDGSHVPVRPDCATNAVDYRNYKGWLSILAVAYVDSYHMFVDADVGAAGRSGDNTVLTNSHLYQNIAANRAAYLGPGGVILGDGGISDADQIFLCPYRSPTTPEDCWFNFCHSSTRFFVEETFGHWKNRFRFLLRGLDCKQKLFTQMVYTSMILHNVCTFHRQDDGLTLDEGSDDEWRMFHETYDVHSCPSCTRRGVRHCPHEWRNRCTGAGAHSDNPTAKRDEIRDALWESLCAEGPGREREGEGDHEVVAAEGEHVAEMRRRAFTGEIRPGE